MHNEYDVLIVGAGPSGLSVALTAVLEGLKVVIIERKVNVGVPVKCGELLPDIKEVERLLPNTKSIKNMYIRFQKDKAGMIIKNAIESTIANKISKICLYSPNNNSFRFNFKGIVINRELFEQYLATKIEDLGATLMTSTIIEALDKGEKYKISVIDGSRRRSFIKARFLVAADGFPSTLAKILNLKHGYKRSDMVLCVQKRVTDIQSMDPRVVEMYLDERYAPGGYAWIIPKNDEKANVGLGVRLPYIRRIQVLKCLESFLKNHKIASHYFIRAKPSTAVVKMVPVGGLVKDVASGKTLLVGDAAGLVIPINGSGIPTALASGYIAGKIISQCVSEECDLSAYVSVLRRCIKPILDRGLLYRKLFDALRASKLLEKALQLLGSSGMGSVIRCEWPMKVLQNVFSELKKNIAQFAFARISKS
jgi:geranylgeranyl reductase family protein